MFVSEAGVQSQAKKFKKLLESYVTFYPYKGEKEDYIMIRYNRFNSVTSNLILTTQGELVSRDVAIPIFLDYIAYDSCMLDCSGIIAKDKEVSVELPKQMKHLIDNAAMPVAMELQSSNLIQDLKLASAMAEANIYAKQRFQGIFNKTVEIDEIVQETRGYLLGEDVVMVRSLNLEWEVLNYDILRKSNAALDAYPRLQAFCQNHNDSLNKIEQDAASRLKQLFKEFSNPAAVKTLKRSLNHFETDDITHQSIHFSKGEKGLREYEENFHLIYNNKKESFIKTNLRNP